MKLIIPNSKELELITLILDLNGTLTVHGELVVGVEEKIQKLKEKGLELVLFSGNTRGNGVIIADKLGIRFIETSTAEDKLLAVRQFNPKTCVTIGNGNIDTLLFREVALSIVTLQKEGIHKNCLSQVDIIVPSILDALDLLIDESSLIATLRT